MIKPVQIAIHIIFSAVTW